MAGTETKRIIELTEASTVQSGDYFPIDSASRGTKKVPTSALATSAALTAETNARAGADEQMSERMDGIEEQTALIQNPTKTLSGALCSFTDGAEMPMVACTASIVPKQSGTGTPSPDNVRPISGWESVSVNATGVNVWDEDWEVGEINGATGAKANTGSAIRSKNFIPVFGGTTYYAHCGSGNIAAVYQYRTDDTHSYIGALYKSNATFAVADDCRYILIASAVSYGTTYNNDISINYPSTDHDYHAYNGTTTTTELGRTVYGGTLDVVSGVLTVDRAMVDLGTLNWTYDGTSYAYGYFTSSAMQSRKAGTLEDAICSNYAVNRGGRYSLGGANGQIASFNETNANAVCVRDDAYTDPTAFKSAMSGVQLVYELATPQTYTLTGQEISTLLGENNVWADSGDVEITYRRDISIVINNLESALNG